MNTGMNTGMNTVCIGEALIDFKEVGELAFQGYVGGSPLNVAVAAARLGANVGFASQLSRDMFGEKILAHMRANAIDTRLVLRSDAPSTLAFVAERGGPGGEVDFSFLANGAADTLYDPQPRPQLPDSVRYLQFGSISLLTDPAATAITDIVAAHRGRAVTVFDPNVRPALIGTSDEAKTRYLAKLERWLGLATVVKVSTQDLRWLYPERDPDEVGQAWLAHGPKAVIVTHGEEGASLCRPGRAPLRVAAPRVEVADTVGAGDTFTGALLVALLERSSDLGDLGDEEASAVLRFAVAAAALNCSRAGADPPRRAEVDSFLEAR